jgi:hypothetical protein
MTPFGSSVVPDVNRARREEDRGGRLGRQRGREPALSGDGGVERPARDRGERQERRRLGPERRGASRRENEHPRSREARHFDDARRACLLVHRDSGATGPEDAEIRNGPLGPALGLEDDAVTGADPRLPK